MQQKYCLVGCLALVQARMIYMNLSGSFGSSKMFSQQVRRDGDHHDDAFLGQESQVYIKQ